MARAIAFGAVFVAGILGALIGHSFMKLQCRNGCGAGPAIGAIVGAVFFAGGAAVVAVLSLRAMGEWRRVELTPGPPTSPGREEPIVRRQDHPDESA